MTAMAAMMLFTGCKKQSEFNKALEADYAEVIAEYPEAVLYEVQTQFNDTFDTRDRKGLHVASAREVFQVEPRLVVFVDRNFETGTREVLKQEGAWLEDLKINLKEVRDVNEALDALFGADIILPDTNFMTLRRPLGPTLYVDAFYVFGSTKTSFVAVNTRTLEVQDFE